MMKLIATSMLHGKRGVALADAGQIGGKIPNLMGNEMDHFALALDLALCLE